MGLGETIVGTLVGTVAGEAVRPSVSPATDNGQGASGAVILWALAGLGVGAWLAWTYRDELGEWLDSGEE